MDSSSDLTTFLLVFWAIWLAGMIFATVCGAIILRKAGYSGWLILLAFVPVVNFVAYLMFVFGEWPIQRELAILRAQVHSNYSPTGSSYGYPPAGYGYPPAGYGDPPYGGGSQPPPSANW
jgi:hypothetical protein